MSFKNSTSKIALATLLLSLPFSAQSQTTNNNDEIVINRIITYNLYNTMTILEEFKQEPYEFLIDATLTKIVKLIKDANKQYYNHDNQATVDQFRLFCSLQRYCYLHE